MAVLYVPVVAVILLYAPGRAWLRTAQQRPGRPGCQLLAEVLFSASTASWIGFTLAESGAYSLWLLCSLQGVVTVLGLWMRWARPFAPYERGDAYGLLVVLAAWLWAAPPLDTRLLAGDSTGYVASGIHVSGTGSFVIHDASLDHLSLDQRRILFPSVAADHGSPPYLRLPGSMILRSLDRDEVLPAFHHLLSMWLAVAADSVGSERMEWLVTLFAGLALWAVASAAAQLGGWGAGALVVVLLLLQLPQYWYSRFLMPEVPAQFFLWASVSLLVAELARRETRPAKLFAFVPIGLGFGVAALMRLENAFFIVPTLALLAIFHAAARPAVWRAAVCAAPLWLHLALHTICFRTHYFGNLRTTLANAVSQITPAMAVALMAASAGLLLLTRGRPRRGAAATLILIVAVGMGVYLDASHHWESLTLLVRYCGIAAIALGIVAMLWLSLAHDQTASTFFLSVLLAAMSLQFLYSPHATPVPIWVIRRAVPILIPALCVALAVWTATALRRPGWRVAAAATLLVTLIASGRALWPLYRLPFYRGARHHVDVLSSLIEPNSVLLVDARLAGHGLAPQLWIRNHSPAYYALDNDRGRIDALVAAFPRRHLYWVGDGNGPLPALSHSSLQPIAAYDFVLLTPRLELGAAADAVVATETAVALYEIETEPKSKTPPADASSEGAFKENEL